MNMMTAPETMRGMDTRLHAQEIGMPIQAPSPNELIAAIPNGFRRLGIAEQVLPRHYLIGGRQRVDGTSITKEWRIAGEALLCTRYVDGKADGQPTSFGRFAEDLYYAPSDRHGGLVVRVIDEATFKAN